jgi:hypothetical protein
MNGMHGRGALGNFTSPAHAGDHVTGGSPAHPARTSSFFEPRVSAGASFVNIDMDSRFGVGIVAVLLLGFVAGGAASAGDKGPCTIATKGDTPTAKACATGGRKAAHKLMKDMVKAAKDKGAKFECDNCHKDLDNYELSKNAADDYKKLEAAVAKK